MAALMERFGGLSIVLLHHPDQVSYLIALGDLDLGAPDAAFDRSNDHHKHIYGNAESDNNEARDANLVLSLLVRHESCETHQMVHDH